jgi:hypothetical protein
VWRKHLPGLFKKLTRIPDLRRPGSVRHQIAVVLFDGLLLFLFQYASRREANRNATGPTLLAAIQEVFPDIASVPHFDTVERLLRTISVETWDAVLRDRITTLLRKHAGQHYLVQHQWVVAVDGSEKFARHQPFAPEALRQQFSDTNIRYRAYVVAAVLVVASGITLPLTSLFAENDSTAPPVAPGARWPVPERPAHGPVSAVSLGLPHRVTPGVLSQGMGRGRRFAPAGYGRRAAPRASMGGSRSSLCVGQRDLLT